MARTTLFLVALLLAGCSADRSAETHLAEYVALAGPGVDTTAVFPGADAARHVVGVAVHSGDDAPLWLTGATMGLRFYAVTDAPRTLLVEARPPTPPGAPSQTITTALDRAVIEVREMDPTWQTYEFRLPADAIEPGWNRLDLRFARTIRPADYDATSNDRRELAALLRRVEIHVDGAGDIDAAPIVVAWPEPASPVPDHLSATIDMPAGSMTEIYLLSRADTELLGDVSATPGTSADDLAVQIEVLAENGVRGGPAVAAGSGANPATTVWEGSSFDAWWGSAPVRANLGEWADRIIRLRIRVTGTAGGSARFTGLRTRSAATAFDERLGIPAAVHPGTARRDAAPAAQQPDIFVIVLDAARADAVLGDRGAELAPHIRELASHATTFHQAWSPAAWTGQSVPAVLTGMTPDTLGITSWESRLPPGFDTLPGALRAAGYYNYLFTQHVFYEPHDELLADFDDVETAITRDRLPDPARLVDDARPTFAFIHLLPPHDPYDAPEPFAGTRSAWYEGDADLDLDLLRDFDTLVPPDDQDEVRRFAVARYEENVAHADHLVGRIIAELKQLERYDDAIVVLLSDHGEAFGEHGTFLHGGQLFEEATHVPLVIKAPRRSDSFAAGPAGASPAAGTGAARPADSTGPDAGSARRPAGVDAAVSTLDLAPTLLELAGVNDQSMRFQGRSLAATLFGAPSETRLILSQTVDGPWPLYALRWGDLKLIYAARTRIARLFDLGSDPDEHTDIASRMPLQTEALMQALRVSLARNEALLVAAGDRAIEQLDEETIRRLRALGYLR